MTNREEIENHETFADFFIPETCQRCNENDVSQTIYFNRRHYNPKQVTKDIPAYTCAECAPIFAMELLAEVDPEGEIVPNSLRIYPFIGSRLGGRKPANSRAVANFNMIVTSVRNKSRRNT